MNISEEQEDFRTVENLVQELYDAACEAKNWALVRHTSGLSICFFVFKLKLLWFYWYAREKIWTGLFLKFIIQGFLYFTGLLGKKLPSLALSLTDLIVRQKQVTVGLPGKEIIISRPLGAQELKDRIYRQDIVGHWLLLENDLEAKKQCFLLGT